MSWPASLRREVMKRTGLHTYPPSYCLIHDCCACFLDTTTSRSVVAHYKSLVRHHRGACIPSNSNPKRLAYHFRERCWGPTRASLTTVTPCQLTQRHLTSSEIIAATETRPITHGENGVALTSPRCQPPAAAEPLRGAVKENARAGGPVQLLHLYERYAEECGLSGLLVSALKLEARLWRQLAKVRSGTDAGRTGSMSRSTCPSAGTTCANSAGQSCLRRQTSKKVARSAARRFLINTISIARPPTRALLARKTTARRATPPSARAVTSASQPFSGATMDQGTRRKIASTRTARTTRPEASIRRDRPS